MISNAELNELRGLIRDSYNPDETNRKIFRDILINEILRIGEDMIDEIERSRQYKQQCKAFFDNLTGDGSY